MGPVQLKLKVLLVPNPRVQSTLPLIFRITNLWCFTTRIVSSYYVSTKCEIV